jgi:SAM-dependent MidA family methyltransferase
METLRYSIPLWVKESFGTRTWISFSEWMHLALYHPVHGYYQQNQTPIGTLTGDFVTAPQLSYWFGASLAESIKPWLLKIKPVILEFGAGNGQLAIDIYQHLLQQNIQIETYYILEVSDSLRQQQQALIKQHLPNHLEHFVWLKHLPSSFDGVILANEVLDAMPVDLFVIKESMIFERGVNKVDDQVFWQDKPATDQLKNYLQSMGNVLSGLSPAHQTDDQSIAYTYVSETHEQSRAWLKTLASMLNRGAILLIDYGFDQTTYYHPQRYMGTLNTHRAHRSGFSPLDRVGEQDITAHVNFSALYQAGLEIHLSKPTFQLAGYTTQTHFLLSSGILDLVRQDSSSFQKLPTHRSGVPTSTALQLLLAEHEMGELFKVMAFVSHPDLLHLNSGFNGRDESGRL